MELRKFKTIINTVTKGLPKWSLLVFSNGYVMGDSTKITNDHLRISHPIPWKIEGEILAHPLKRFLQIAEEPIRLSQDENTLLVRAGRATVFLPMDSVKRPIVIPKFKWKPLSEDFWGYVSKCLPFTYSDGDLYRSLKGVHCTSDRIEASDGHQMIHFEVQEKVHDFSLHRTAMRYLSRAKPDKVFESNMLNEIYFSKGNYLYSAKRIDNFPSTAHLLKDSPNCLEFPEEVVKMIERSKIVNFPGVRLVSHNKVLRIYSEYKSETFSESIPTDMEEFKLHFQKEFLLNIFRLNTKVQVREDNALKAKKDNCTILAQPMLWDAY